MRCLELFTGAGGLALGIGQAGFCHAGLIEFDHDSCETIRFNKSLPNSPVANWPILEADTRSVKDFSKQFRRIDVVAGGPPCQPFSLGGKHKAFLDRRDMFSEAVRAVRQTQPKAFIFENVKGLLRRKFSTYFEYILLQLKYPKEVKLTSEEWVDHLARLEQIETNGNYDDLHYNVVFRLVNAADYGIPQKRERVFMIGFRSDLTCGWSFPEPTHSRTSLQYSQCVVGNYWETHGLNRPRPSGKVSESIRRVYENQRPLLPWVTVRDALADLPDPKKNPIESLNHVFVDGARQYAGHTGSPKDEPAKTLKAGDHGVPGGENTVILSAGRVRYFTLRECARLQTFPDAYRFNRSWTESMRQMGNAVPVTLGRIVAESVEKCLTARRRPN